MKYPLIETERLFLRRPTAADRQRLLQRIGAVGDAGVSASLADGRAWRQIAAILTSWETCGHGLFAVLALGEAEAIGVAGPWHAAGWPEPEIAWAFWAPQALRDGLALEAVAAARHFATDTLGWRDAVSYVAPGDIASVGILAALGAVADPSADAPADCAVQVWRHPTPRRRLARAA